MSFNTSISYPNPTNTPEKVDIFQPNLAQSDRRQEMIQRYNKQYKAAHPMKFWIRNKLWKASMTLFGVGFLIPRILNTQWVRANKWIYLSMAHKRHYFARRVSKFGWKVFYGFTLFSIYVSYGQGQYIKVSMENEEQIKGKVEIPGSQL